MSYLSSHWAPPSQLWCLIGPHFEPPYPTYDILSVPTLCLLLLVVMSCLSPRWVSFFQWWCPICPYIEPHFRSGNVLSVPKFSLLFSFVTSYVSKMEPPYPSGDILCVLTWSFLLPVVMSYLSPHGASFSQWWCPICPHTEPPPLSGNDISVPILSLPLSVVMLYLSRHWALPVSWTIPQNKQDFTGLLTANFCIWRDFISCSRTTLGMLHDAQHKHVHGACWLISPNCRDDDQFKLLVEGGHARIKLTFMKDVFMLSYWFLYLIFFCSCLLMLKKLNLLMMKK